MYFVGFLGYFEGKLYVEKLENSHINDTGGWVRLVILMGAVYGNVRL